VAKIYKAEIYFVDANDDYSSFEDILNDIETFSNITTVNTFNAEEKEIEWHDDIDLNFVDQPIEVYRKYFE